MTIGEKIKTQRLGLGLTQTELGKKLGVQKNAVSKWECGRVDDIPTSKIKAMAQLFGVDPSYLIDDAKAEIPTNAVPIDFSHLKRIPILGRIAAGTPIYAAENIEGYTYTDLNGGHEYFGLRVRGDSMDAARIHDGDVVIVRRQDVVDNGQIAVCLIDGEEATLKRFMRNENIVTLMPQSTNPVHQALVFDIRQTHVDILGLVVRVEFAPV